LQPHFDALSELKALRGKGQSAAPVLHAHLKALLPHIEKPGRFASLAYFNMTALAAISPANPDTVQLIAQVLLLKFRTPDPRMPREGTDPEFIYQATAGAAGSIYRQNPASSKVLVPALV